jgi:Tol biopolymer transport system component
MDEMAALPHVPYMSDLYLTLAFSPDGQRVAYVAQVPGFTDSEASGYQELFVMTLDDRSVVELTHNPGRDPCAAQPD